MNVTSEINNSEEHRPPGRWSLLELTSGSDLETQAPWGIYRNLEGGFRIPPALSRLHKSEHQDRQPGDSVKGLERRRGTGGDTPSFFGGETAVSRGCSFVRSARPPARYLYTTLPGKQSRPLIQETTCTGHCGGHCDQSPLLGGALWSTSVLSSCHAPLTQGEFTVLLRGSKHRGTNKSFGSKSVSGSRKAKRGGIPRVL